LNSIGNIDSKYRFIILASKRAKQLLKGAKPKISVKSKNLIRIAQAEVSSGLIEYEIIPAGMEEIPEREDRVFVGVPIADESVETDLLAGKDLLEEVIGEGEAEEEVEDEEEADEAEEDKDE
jgi:DNA-directed RNA polymerase subunit K/omega